MKHGLYDYGEAIHFSHTLEYCALLLVSSKLTLCTCLDIRNWIRNIEQHASDNVNKILVGNKADMDESKRVLSPL